jgi:hypothetical protein
MEIKKCVDWKYFNSSYCIKVLREFWRASICLFVFRGMSFLHTLPPPSILILLGRVGQSEGRRALSKEKDTQIFHNAYFSWDVSVCLVFLWGFLIWPKVQMDFFPVKTFVRSSLSLLITGLVATDIILELL